jgi:release factor glutamine methyltransferase
MAEAVKTWNVLDIIKVTEKLFADKGIANPRLNAELLLAETLQTGRMSLYLNFDKPLTENELSGFRSKVKRRLQREPLQYIIGKTEFYGLEFKVSPAVLIPRQETELLVDTALGIIKSSGLVNPKILDIGTGSGCITIAIASKTDCRIDAIDISEDALETALKNSSDNNTSGKITFSKKDILKDSIDFGTYDLIISNPPYIAASEMETLQPEVRQFEPGTALTDGGDGTVFYKRIFDLALNSSKPVKLLLELGDGKAGIIKDLTNNYTFGKIEIYKDLIGIQRVLYIEK